MAKQTKKKLGLFGRLLWLLNILFALLLAASILASYIGPDTFWPLAVFGLAYPLLAIINFVFMIYWIIRGGKYFLISLILLIASWSNIPAHFQVISKSKPAEDQNLIKLMSFNVKNFDLYNYNADWSFNFEKRNEIFRFLRKENADIVCLQEFVHDHVKGGFNTLDSLENLPKTKHKHTAWSITTRKKTSFGIATLSSYPIINRGTIRFKDKTNNIAIFSDMLIWEDTVRVFNIHLESIHLGKEDHEFAKSLGGMKPGDQDEEFQEGSKRILKRLRKAFIRRANQAKLIHEKISQSPYPVIVCGDFNDTPASYAYRLVSKDLKDAFRESGSGRGNSYAGFSPSFRIDYILYKPYFCSYGFQTMDVDLSDHYPVQCWIGKR